MHNPNILLITTDQQHYSMLGTMNNKIKTPCLDKLAQEGINFERAYCANPTCSPSRSSILTGMYPSHHGCWSLGTKLPEDTPTLAQYLNQNGYETALIGKAHFQQLVSTEKYMSIESTDYLWNREFWENFNSDFYGFNHVELLRNHTAEKWVGQHYAIWMEKKGLKNWRKYFFRPTGKMHNKAMGSWKIPEEYHYNTWIAERTNAMLEKYKEEDTPFFLWASFPDPHYPQLVPAPWDKMYNPDDMELPEFSYNEHDKNPPYFKEVCKMFPHLKQYRETGMGVHGLQKHYYNEKNLKKQLAYAYGMVSFTDKYIGKILDKIKELDLEKDTIIVFTTDHGDLFGQHGLRHKCIFHYEDLLRVPMIVKYKNHIPEGIKSNSLQSLIDLAPTFLSYCSLPIPEYMDGINQCCVWNGEKNNNRNYVISENRHEPHTLHMYSYVEKDYKITVHEGRDYGELYDLKNDSGEHNNLWNDSIYSELKAELLYKFNIAEMKKDNESRMTYDKDGCTLKLDAYVENGMLIDTDGIDRWNAPNHTEVKISILLETLSKRISERPMWMPRVSGA